MRPWCAYKCLCGNDNAYFAQTKYVIQSSYFCNIFLTIYHSHRQSAKCITDCYHILGCFGCYPGILCNKNIILFNNSRIADNVLLYLGLFTYLPAGYIGGQGGAGLVPSASENRKNAPPHTISKIFQTQKRPPRQRIRWVVFALDWVKCRPKSSQ